METVKDRWIHAARGLASTELSFHSCNVLRDCRRGVPRANKKMKAGVRKNDDLFAIMVRITGKLLQTADTLNAPYLPNAKAYELQTL